MSLLDKPDNDHVEDVKHKHEAQDVELRSHGEERLTLELISFALVVSFAPLLANFDYSFAGFVLATPSFNMTFGSICVATGSMPEICQMSALQQSLLAIASLFQALGAALAGVAGAWLGRRAVLTLACAFSIAGAIIMLALDGNFTAFMAGKCISGVGLGALVAVGIAYGVECIPPGKRPVLLSLYGVANALGVFVGACVLVGSSKLQPATNDWQWKTLVAIQIPAGLALASLLWLFPESPRWLLIHGDVSHARKAFATYYNLDEQAEEVSRLVQNTQDYLEEERAMQASTTWVEMYKGQNLRRTIISGFILAALALSGVQFILTYGTVFLLQAGISNIFVTNVAIASCTLAGSLLSPVSLEFAGCRGSLLWSFAATATCMLTFAAVSTGLGASSETSRTVLVVFVCLWAFCFAAGIGGAAWLASTEMHSLRLRTYGQASSAATYQIWSFASTFWTPYMLRPEYGNMGTNVGYFFFGLSMVMFVLTFLFVPETAKLSLEQIDDYFNSGRPAWKTSLGRNKKQDH